MMKRNKNSFFVIGVIIGGLALATSSQSAEIGEINNSVEFQKLVESLTNLYLCNPLFVEVTQKDKKELTSLVSRFTSIKELSVEYETVKTIFNFAGQFVDYDLDVSLVEGLKNQHDLKSKIEFLYILTMIENDHVLHIAEIIRQSAGISKNQQLQKVIAYMNSHGC